jgi:plasmid maintenance system antidote protein VapI
MRMQRAGIRHSELAEVLDVSREFVTQILTGKKRWPARLEQRALQFIHSRERRPAG